MLVGLLAFIDADRAISGVVPALGDLLAQGVAFRFERGDALVGDFDARDDVGQFLG